MRVDQLIGCIPAYRDTFSASGLATAAAAAADGDGCSTAAAVAAAAATEGDDDGCDTSARPSALRVEGQLCSYGEALGIPMSTAWAAASPSGAAWDAWLAFPLKYRDLGHDAQLALTVHEVREGRPIAVLAGATLRLFSKRGRLKTGPQELLLWLGQPADTSWPGTTPGKLPLAERGELG